MSNPDFTVSYHGTITLLKPHTVACRAWITENVEIEPWQWFGHAIAVEPRYLDTIATALIEEGFVPGED